MGTLSISGVAKAMRRLARFWDGNGCGDSYGLTTFAPIKAGEDDPLERYLSAMPVGPHSPLARMPQLHCSRLHILRDLVYQGGNQTPEPLLSKWLIFTASFDGGFDEFLGDLHANLPKEADEIWGHCVGYPGTGDLGEFRRYFERIQVHNHYYLSPFPNATVSEIRGSLAVRDEVARFAAAAGQMDAETLQRRFLETFG